MRIVFSFGAPDVGAVTRADTFQVPVVPLIAPPCSLKFH